MSIPSRVSTFPSGLVVMHQLGEGTFNPIIQVFYKCAVYYWMQYCPLRNSACDRFNSGLVITPFKFRSLAAFHPPYGAPLQFISYHLVNKDVVGDCVKYLAKIKVMSRLLLLPLF